MLRQTIKLDDKSDPIAIVQSLRAVVAASAVQGEATTSLAELEETILGLAKSGQELAQIGSQFDADRTVKGHGFEVTIRARYGRKPGLIARLLGR